ncbi:MAG: esterase [Oscillospiraceae bacterium]|nr:esterase [Oscillospiraceae bacterium]
MVKRAFLIGENQCFAYGDEEPRFLLIQPEGERAESPVRQPECISSLCGSSFLHVSFRVTDWNKELSPWNAAPVFGRDAFGNGAAGTLMFIMEKLLPYVRAEFGIGPKVPMVLGGYSLAAFFALWCAYQTDTFSAIAAASPSVWFPGWIEYAGARRPLAGCIYLSLGDREKKAKNSILSSVGDCLREQYRLLEESGVRSMLEWNPGNHFTDPELRCAKGFVWCMEKLGEQADGDNGNHISR